jgi:hypothetical protein
MNLGTSLFSSAFEPIVGMAGMERRTKASRETTAADLLDLARKFRERAATEPQYRRREAFLRCAQTLEDAVAGLDRSKPI